MPSPPRTTPTAVPATASPGLVAEYRERTPRSAASFNRTSRVLPGGETRAVTSFSPYPVELVEGRGSRLWDVDGHSYLDLVNNYTALVHGNAFPPVVEAVADLLPRGTVFASPHRHQVALAEHLCARLPAVERVRFTNSGTEAALLAVRIAQRATGRARILLFDGAYHGSATALMPGSADVVVAPWNDLAAVERLLTTGEPLAAVLAEPFLGAGGVRPAAPGFLAAVEAAARSRGTLFVLDEVQSLRNGASGQQAVLGLVPDLTLLGKIIGGGFPIGAVGGRADLLALTVASRTPRHVAHAGTFNGHLAAAVAGLVALDHLDAATIDRLNAASEWLGTRIAALATTAGIDAHVTRAGSILNVHIGTPTQLADLHVALLLEGIYATPRGMINLSTALTEAELDNVATAYARALARVARAPRSLAPARSTRSGS
jgi:glutamate-1-semialdehyde 2,1-aminomutase